MTKKHMGRALAKAVVQDLLTLAEAACRVTAFRLGAFGCRVGGHDLVVVDGTRAWCKRCRQAWGGTTGYDA